METTNSIRTYRNTVFIDFSQRGRDFTLDVPNYKEWLNLISFLRKRGFKVTENKYYKKHYACLSPYNKIGVKKDVRLLMEIQPSRIKIQFGSVKNLWTNIVQSFWDNKSDNRYASLTYLEEKAVELEVKRVVDMFKNKGFVYELNDYERTDIENIIHYNNQNTHIHGKITCLKDIAKSITEDSYNYTQNSWDKNKKRIICGDKKCFYDYNKRLAIGTVYHHINNMWWVIVNGKRFNVASFRLFDYDVNLPKKEPASREVIFRLLDKYKSENNFKKCLAIANFHNEIVYPQLVVNKLKISQTDK